VADLGCYINSFGGVIMVILGLFLLGCLVLVWYWWYDEMQYLKKHEEWAKRVKEENAEAVMAYLER